MISRGSAKQCRPRPNIKTPKKMATECMMPLKSPIRRICGAKRLIRGKRGAVRGRAQTHLFGVAVTALLGLTGGCDLRVVASRPSVPSFT
jgi:hypothetical protein